MHTEMKLQRAKKNLFSSRIKKAIKIGNYY